MTARTSSPSHPSASRYRWRIAALLFVATTINYVDRSLLGVLAPMLQYKVFHWTDAEFAAISMSFKLAYAVGLLGTGALIDRWGARLGYVLCVAVWSCFALLHTLIRPAFGLVGFIIVRFGLGLGESGNFPAAIKAVSIWFPAKERALATGLFNAGSNVGAILAPLIVLLVVQPSGADWQFTFILTSAVSVVWCGLWLITYHDPQRHPHVSEEELCRSQSEQGTVNLGTPKPGWVEVIRTPITWKISVLRLADAAWWFYLFWGGKFLFDRFGLDIRSVALPLVLIYGMADVGGVIGGWSSSRLIARGWRASRAHKAVMFVCALLISPVAGVTGLATHFEIDQRFFERVIHAHVQLTAEQVSLLNRERGRSYATAREFEVVLERVSAQAPLSSTVEAACIAAARANQLYWIATLLIALAAAGHQAWAANLFSLIGDYVGKESVASVTGFSGMVGAVSALMADFLVGHALTHNVAGGYFVAFIGAGVVYLVVLGLFQVLLRPRKPSYACDL